MNMLSSLLGGLTGAATLTAMHQAAKHSMAKAPRVDVLGRRAIAGPVRAMGFEPPSGQTLQNTALAGDLLSNSAFYAMLGLSSPKHLWRNATLMGLAAGVGAVALPPVLGLGSKPTSRTTATAAMTIAWYTLGALAAAGTMSAVDDESRP